MGDGMWDSAFEVFEGTAQMAPPCGGLEGNVFGEHPYVDNRMHKAASGQTMFDANDAIIFLAPLEELRPGDAWM